MSASKALKYRCEWCGKDVSRVVYPVYRDERLVGIFNLHDPAIDYMLQERSSTSIYDVCLVCVRRVMLAKHRLGDAPYGTS